MSQYQRMLRSLALLLMLLSVTGLSSLLNAQEATPSGSSTRPPAALLQPPADMRIAISTGEADIKALLNPRDAVWNQSKPAKVLLNRTPRVYQTESTELRKPPALEVRAWRAGGKLYVRLQWDDPTENKPIAPQKKSGEGGSAAQLYKQPTGETSTFADAAAVMVPEKWAGGGFPSVVMGDQTTPSNIYYWNASRGTQVLRSTGRATQKPTGDKFNHQANYLDGKWTIVDELPDRADGTPMAFAIWDGQFQDRDGLKFFSVWYVIGSK